MEWFQTKYVTLWYASTCFFFFGYTMLLFVEDYLNYKDEEMKDHSLAWMERKTIKSSTVQYTRLLDFFTKKLKLCSWLQIKGVMNHTFVANFCFLLFYFIFLFYLKWCSILQNQQKNCFGLIYVHFICLSHLLIFSSFNSL